MKITYFGHSCFGIETSHHRILFDPFITPNPLASQIDVDQIEADFIFISHGHQDHIADAEYLAKRTGATVVANYEIYSWLINRGVANGHPMNTGGKWTFEFGQVQMVAAMHSSSLPDGTYGGSANGFVIQFGDKTFYYAGDTALFSDMKQIPDTYNIDFAFLPIGSNFTMDLFDACKAAHYVNTRKVIGMHYDTFPYIVVDKEEAISIAHTNGIDLHLMEIGGVLDL